VRAKRKRRASTKYAWREKERAKDQIHHMLEKSKHMRIMESKTKGMMHISNAQAHKQLAETALGPTQSKSLKHLGSPIKKKQNGPSLQLSAH
jgi:hypothetical protein